VFASAGVLLVVVDMGLFGKTKGFDQGRDGSFVIADFNAESTMFVELLSEDVGWVDIRKAGHDVQIVRQETRFMYD
jgi:hypothetical protein